ncbi:MAG: HAMP domain-containing sensor histidine kinase [Vicinamibacterales bacterium]|nr:HAMP domain-containing sensor histidine kinase [Vicinamibacterales bacterium]
MSDQPAALRYALSHDDLVRINRAILVAAVVRGTVHSVNNILQTIGGQAEMLAQRPDALGDIGRRAERISAQTARAAGYMRELSALGRELPSAPDRVDIRQCLDRVYALREYDLQRAHIAFEARFDADPVPPARIDMPALSQIVLNLLLNAEQALADTPDARIDVVVGAAAGRTCISVRDDGPGIGPDGRDRIFEAFQTTGAAGASLGLGLPVARYLAEQHGGHLVLADPVAGHGAQFDLDLPAMP